MNFVIRHSIYIFYENEIEDKLKEFNCIKSLNDIGIEKNLINVPGE